MKLHVRPSRLRGEIAVPGSKSHTIRGIIAALQSKGRCVLRAPLESADTRSSLKAAEKLGASVAVFPDHWEIQGMNGHLRNPGGGIDMGNSGTGLRLLTALAANQNFPVSFDGDESLRTRQMAGLFDALTPLGAQISSTGGKCPFTIQGPLHGGATKVDGKSSQFLTALLFTLPALPGDSTIELDYLFEQPYVGITMAWLDDLGIRYHASADLLHWEIPGGQSFKPFDRVIPADFSTASFPLVAGVLAGDGVTIRNLDFNDAQGDKLVFGFMERLGAKLLRGEQLTVAPSHVPPVGCELDLNATPDALPVLAVAGALAQGETRLVNVAQARVKETDRIAVMTAELRKMGAQIEELPDGMIIQGGRLHGAELDSHDDHRIAMALAIAGLCATGETVIARAEAAAVSYPGFLDDFRRLGADFSTEK